MGVFDVVSLCFVDCVLEVLDFVEDFFVEIVVGAGCAGEVVDYVPASALGVVCGCVVPPVEAMDALSWGGL